MEMEQIGQEIFENKKSRISSIHDVDEDNEDVINSADQLMWEKKRNNKLP